jgi:hypothetical protein
MGLFAAATANAVVRYKISSILETGINVRELLHRSHAAMIKEYR